MELNTKVENEENRLIYVREWFIVYFFLITLITVSILSYSKKQSLIAPTDQIEVIIIGAVQKEKTVRVHPLSTVADILAQTILSSDADTDKLFIEEKVKPGFFIVPKKQVVTIYVTGAVKKSGIYHVPQSTRFNELSTYLPLSKEADTRYFSRKRRYVLEGELVVVPMV